MSRRLHLTQSEIIAVMRLMADVAAHHRQPAVQRRLLIEGIEKLVGATLGFSFVCDGWLPHLSPRFISTHMLSSTTEPFSLYARNVMIPHTIRADPYCDGAICRTAKVDLLTQREAMPTSEAHKKYGPFNDWGAQMNLRDGVVAWARLDELQPGAMTGFALHRLGKSRLLSHRDLELVKLATSELYRLAAKGWYSLPEFTPDLNNRVKRLPARLRDVLMLVLSGRHPKGIAHDLNLSIHTVREHLQRLYRYFDVSGREGLMALFIDNDSLLSMPQGDPLDSAGL